MATLYVHIGMPKTGTSSIQNFLLENASNLERNGICFPYMDLKFPKVKYKARRNGHFLVYRSELFGEANREEEQTLYRQGFDIIRKKAKTCGKIVITDEAIWYRQNRKERFWQEVKQNAGEAGCDTVKVVVYLRRQDLYVQASWNQSVKYYPRLHENFYEFLQADHLNNHNLDYYAKLCEIAEAIGKENLIVRVFEKEQLIKSPDGIFSDFMEAISEKMDPAYTIPEETLNQNLSGNYIEIKRKINESPAYMAEEDFLNEPVTQASNINKAGKVSFFSYEDQEAYLKQFQQSNALVAKEFLGFANGILFSEPLEKLPRWELDPSVMWEDILRVYTETAVAQYREIKELKQGLKEKAAAEKELKKRVKAIEKKMVALEEKQKPFFVRFGKRVVSKLRRMFQKQEQGN